MNMLFIEYHFILLIPSLIFLFSFFQPMPRTSNRYKLISSAEKEIVKRCYRAHLRLLLSLSDPVEDYQDQTFLKFFKQMHSTRYFTRSAYRSRRVRLDWNEYLNPESEFINDDEFLRLFRVSRNSFNLLLAEMERSPVFNKSHKFKKPRPVFQQLLVFLYRVGRFGSSGSCHEVGLFFGIATGSVRNYVANVVEALKMMEPEVVYWPSDEERQEMKTRLSPTGFRHCVGFADGTLIPLTTKPKIFHECYYCRKHFYALNVLVVCDDNSRIIYHYGGWPGSTHDNRVFKNSLLYRHRNQFFSPLEYVIGDSAYSDNSIMVQSFKKRQNEQNLPRDKELFNSQLATIRIKIEHCIGMLKGRFQCLKGMNTFIKTGRKDVKHIVDIFSACAVLHNLLLSYDDMVPQEWYENLVENIDFQVMEDIENIETVDNIESEGNVCRRETVFNSIVETFGV